MIFEVSDIIISPWIPLLWGVLVGLVFSTIGAAGGILASVGLISILSIQNPNLIKPMAQMLTLVTPLVAIPLYMKQCRLIISLAIILGAGGIIGAIVGSSLSINYLSNMTIFKPVFAVLVLLIAAQIIWHILSKKQKLAAHTKRASQNFENLIKNNGNPCSIGVRHTQWSVLNIEFSFGNENFRYNPWLPFFTGMGIAIFSSALGVGGGFLLVPFMSIIMRLPMFIVAATSTFAIAIHSITSISNYVRLGIDLDFPLLGLLLAGTAIGSIIGPYLSKYLPENWLRGILSLVLVIIGLRYLSVF
ncbi:MAG: sulfite exporter TauE/SafE family protein [Gammaproteobacteria bacterium]